MPHIFIILLIAGWLISGCTRSTIAPGQCPDYKFGVILSENSDEGIEQRTGYDFAQASNRIGECEFTLLYRDEGTLTDRETAQIAALDLARAGVVAIIGATSDQASMRVAGVARYLEIPLLIPLEVSEQLAQESNPWVFKISPPQAAIVDLFFEMLANNLGKDAKVAILFEKSEFGESVAVTAGQAALARGIKISAYLGFQTTSLDKAAVIRELAESNPNSLVVISSNTVQAMELFSALKEMASLTYLTGIGYGFTSQSFLYNNLTGELNMGLEGLSLATIWNEDVSFPGTQEFLNRFYLYRSDQGNGDATPPTIRQVQAYVALQLIIDVLNSIPDLAELIEDIPLLRQTVADALLDLTGIRQNSSILGPLSFDPTGQSSTQTVLVQVQNGRLITIYPMGMAGEAVIQPLP